jgi:hypothetical protein
LSDYIPDFINQNKIILIDLGLKFLQEKTISKYLNTFWPEVVIIIALIIYIIYSYKDEEIISNTRKIIKSFKNRFFILIVLQLLLLAILTCLNLNYLTLLYSSKFTHNI